MSRVLRVFELNMNTSGGWRHVHPNNLGSLAENFSSAGSRVAILLRKEVFREAVTDD